MSIESFILIFCSVATTILGALVYLRNPTGRSNQRFALLSLSLVGWTVFNYLSDATIASNSALLYTRLTFFWGVAAIFSLIRFIAYFPNETIYKKSILLKIHSSLSLILLPITLTPIFISSVVSIPEPEIHTSYLYPLFIACVAYSLLFLPLIIMKQYKNTQLIIQRQQLSIVSWGIAIYAILAVASSVVLPLAFDTWSSSRYGPLFTLALVGVVAYSIVKHKMFDIKLIIARSVAYSLLVVTISGLYVVIAFGVIGSISYGSPPTTTQEVVYAILAVILALTFQPLRHFFEKTTNTIFFRDHYDPQNLLSNLGSIITREIELKQLANKVIWELVSEMKLTKAIIVVLDKGQIFYEANIESINHETISLEDLKNIGTGIVLKDALEASNIPKLFSNKYGLSASIELHTNNELVGYLLLGEKKSGDIFNHGDIKTLRIFAQELAITIVNAKSYTQIQDFNKTLQAKVEEATKQLRDANAHLQELDQLKNEFLSMATHQLNTPLTVVDGYLDMMNDGVISEPAEQKEYLGKILERTRAMKRMVADFLNVSRIETGKFIMDVKPTDMNKLVTEEFNGLGLSAKEKGVLLQFIAPKHPVPMINTDEQKTRQAVMNLIDNAIYYTPKGEVKVYLDIDPQNVIFKVVDNGIGVPEAQKAKLFQKFYRASNAKDERPNGNGVGLYLVKRIIEDQGGKIIFSSTEGKGSTFGFSLPIKSPLPTKPSPQATPTLTSSTPSVKTVTASTASSTSAQKSTTVIIK